jgi:hypothetical protein
MSPSFWSFLLASFLDARFRRRTYAIPLGVLTAAAAAWVLLHHSSVIGNPHAATILSLLIAVAKFPID